MIAYTGYCVVVPNDPAYTCCGSNFYDHPDYEHHLLNSSRHHYCQPCGIDFRSARAKQAHLAQSDQHQFCQLCQSDVGSNLRAHCQQSHVQCQKCNLWSRDQAHLRRHLISAHADVYCAPCGLLFSQPNNLIMHHRSSVHQPRDVRCPHQACGRSFVSTSALIAHFEAGICPSGVNLDDVDEFFSSHCDHQGLFVRRDLIFRRCEWTIESDYEGRFPCPLCPLLFDHPAQLRQHLDSPRHKNRGHKPYICPSQQCRQATFFSLSALLLHREAGHCEMAHKFEFPKLLQRLYNIIAQL
ncbi:hypothetical protein PGT21_035453 [Puccinia graminis f. sp. tritici]|uniref:C2H2-type domain-containing protein n=1 Tax=Puccinia graminis f. sp. tritici TaxID=56615 RepID=A0A5B0R4H8_PUCGR|nr:hypothetical protein PGTUg99_020886 [Puccinia graminis f. sp. tritici]KAA1119854.1 hypothetical protein PGT21_035453 [Puccinia graminis f. sp. tritici]